MINTRDDYAAAFRRLELDYEDKSLIFCDEVGFSAVFRPNRGRSLRGTAAYVEVAAARSRNISVFAAMNRFGMIFQKVHNKALCGEDSRQDDIQARQLTAAVSIAYGHLVLERASLCRCDAVVTKHCHCLCSMCHGKPMSRKTWYRNYR